MKTLFFRHGKTPNPDKFWELQVMHTGWDSFKMGWDYWDIQPLLIDYTNYFSVRLVLGWLFSFVLSWTKKRDHAGLNWNISIGWWELSLMVYDHRHWDEETEDWMRYPEEEK